MWYALPLMHVVYSSISLCDIQEPECCDGSDEQPGVCPNVCREVGEAYQKQQEAERKVRRTVCGRHLRRCVVD